MSIPNFNESGDLPLGIHKATIARVAERFGFGSGQRVATTRRLLHIYRLAKQTKHVQHFLIFGSYVTSKTKPNDVDIILVMDDSFKLKDCPAESAGLFNHAVAQARYGASIFWTRPMALINETVEEFMAYWQSKRDGSQRGIIEVITKTRGDNDTQ